MKKRRRGSGDFVTNALRVVREASAQAPKPTPRKAKPSHKPKGRPKVR